MARRRRKKTSSKKKIRYHTTQRDFPTITKLSTELLGEPIYKRTRKFGRFGRISNDLRRWNPDKKTPLKQDGTRAKIRLSEKKHKKDDTRRWLRFEDPLRTTICIRRKARRISLFMKGKIGKGKSVKEFKKLTHFSSIKC